MASEKEVNQYPLADAAERVCLALKILDLAAQAIVDDVETALKKEIDLAISGEELRYQEGQLGIVREARMHTTMFAKKMRSLVGAKTQSPDDPHRTIALRRVKLTLSGPHKMLIEILPARRAVECHE